MKERIASALERWLDAGRDRIGQIAIRRDGDRFSLFHRDDVGRADLKIYTLPNGALEIARYNEAGKYRPLKSAPDLRRGWRLELAGVEEVRLALDFFYPAMLGTLLAWENRSLAPVHFRATANRQSGMYAIVKRIGDSQADELIGNFCTSHGGCLKTILWKIDSTRAISTLPETKFDPAVDQTGGGARVIPLLCNEACNLLVAAARTVVK
ncbi:MAG: hypothetical protein M3O82_00960 [Verrucomicrobiota bacterium]|nr:hypothetical protein [Verrucomicrobiota bacterium]